MQIASDFSERHAVHSFANLQAAPLWTSEVKRILPGEQAYERLPAASGLRIEVAENRKTQRIAMTMPAVKAAYLPSAPYPSETSQVEVRQNAWCAARYRSYDPTDNSYQPFGGVSRQPCTPPSEQSAGPIPAALADNSDLGSSDAYVRWCMERYSSYRVEDNTYQPFKGSPRQCSGPLPASVHSL